MNEQFLCRCISNIEANLVANVLDENSIEYRMHDETADQCNGAYGPNPGTAFYVSEQDYQKASVLVDPIINRPSVRYTPFCPKCGSEDTTPISRFKYTTAIQLISILRSSVCILSGSCHDHLERWAFHSCCINFFCQGVKGFCSFLN